ncbi:hypothetical protein Tco_0000719 [Tanacetum coccineum]
MCVLACSIRGTLLLGLQAGLWKHQYALDRVFPRWDVPWGQPRPTTTITSTEDLLRCYFQHPSIPKGPGDHRIPQSRHPLFEYKGPEFGRLLNLNTGKVDEVSPPRHQKERRGKDNRRPPVFGRIGKQVSEKGHMEHPRTISWRGDARYVPSLSVVRKGDPEDHQKSSYRQVTQRGVSGCSSILHAEALLGFEELRRAIPLKFHSKE